MKREKLVTINEANLKEELARVKAQRDELILFLKSAIRILSKHHDPDSLCNYDYRDLVDYLGEGVDNNS